MTTRQAVSGINGKQLRVLSSEFLADVRRHQKFVSSSKPCGMEIHRPNWNRHKKEKNIRKPLSTPGIPNGQQLGS